MRTKMKRYSIITQKNPREMVLLRGRGCFYEKCSFCDYYIDKSDNEEDNFALNSRVLDNVTGLYGQLEVINSGSVFELDKRTLEKIKAVCREKNIHTIHFESHYAYRNKIPALRRDFSDFVIKMKLGLETVDNEFRENTLKKGIAETNPERISEHFDEANFLFGIKGQTAESMRRDIELGLKHFERICINIMCENSASIKPDAGVIRAFASELYPLYRDDGRVDILFSNTDFGVGE